MKRNFLLALLALTLPASAQFIKIEKPTYRVSYDSTLHVPRSVEWFLTPHDLGNIRREPSWRFAADVPEVLTKPNHNDYTHSGLDRGHMVPALDRSASLSSMRSTFVLSNIAPQTPYINRGAWKATEDSCRRLAALFDSIHVLACPVFLFGDTAFIGESRIAVPHAFFKAAWVAGSDSVISCWFIFNHDKYGSYTSRHTQQ